MKPIISQFTLKEKAHESTIRQSKNLILFFLISEFLGKIAPFVVAFLFSHIIPFMFPLFGLCSAIFVTNLLDLAQYIVGIKMVKEENVTTDDVFVGFSDYWNNLKKMFWYRFRVAVWGLVPILGIIKAYAYSLTPYLIYEKPELKAEETLQLSAKLTEGRKMELLALDLSLMGWVALSLLTGGAVGIVYAYPYMHAVKAGYYLNLAEGLSEPPTMKCPHCEHIIEEGVNPCPYCKKDPTKAEDKNKKNGFSVPTDV